ncbi:MAG: methyl-accepting chemotaxis protein [Oscillospiraceae bacterium]|nr:methyl-accepting chemotaxis protein [Oscillospiraceae bacterium]MCL2278754.1 methyl-accepting chemotaxis protein [Oscillospiraceae bacterium]
MLNFKSLTGRVSFIVCTTVIIVGIIIAVYMQTRIIEEITEVSRLSLLREISGLSTESNLYIVEADRSAMPSERVLSAVGNAQYYETGFAALVSDRGEFFETSGRVTALSSADRSAIMAAANAADDNFANVMLGGVRYVMVYETLVNDYMLLALVPNSEYTSEIVASLIRFVVIFVFAFGLVVLISFFVGRTFAKPFTALNKLIHRFSSTGGIKLHEEDSAAVSKYGIRRDEIGQSFNAVVELFKRLDSFSEELETVANGNLTLEITILSKEDVLGNSLHLMNEKLNDTLNEIGASAGQVSSGSKHIAGGSQSLAQGSTEQAASVQQLSSSITAIAQKTKENADMAGRAAMLANDIRTSAEKGSGQMNEMMMAVKDINESSQNISKVIKSIDDIAFQTNILALNAAVEAARAGQHGKGFAVVAEEVRNLAAKSAEAAKDTESLIADSMVKAELGSKIADETSESLAEIVAGIGESNNLVKEIARSSEEQTAGIEQINTGIDQVAQVTQQNSATAQESAAASQEMSDQSDALEQLLSQFKLKAAQSFLSGNNHRNNYRKDTLIP